MILRTRTICCLVMIGTLFAALLANAQKSPRVNRILFLSWWMTRAMETWAFSSGTSGQRLQIGV